MAAALEGAMMTRYRPWILLAALAALSAGCGESDEEGPSLDVGVEHPYARSG
jgi:hypothetical protein